MYKRASLLCHNVSDEAKKFDDNDDRTESAGFKVGQEAKPDVNDEDVYKYPCPVCPKRKKTGVLFTTLFFFRNLRIGPMACFTQYIVVL